MIRPVFVSLMTFAGFLPLAAEQPAAVVEVIVQQGQEAQSADLNKLSAAQQALKDAMAELAKAEAALAAAQGDAAKAEAETNRADASRKLNAAIRQAGAENTQILNKAAGQAGAQAAVVRQPIGGFQLAPEREDVDPQDPVERFALLTPGGPLLIEATITIDGQPFRTVREKLIDELLAAADKDQDGKPTWEEALTSGRFTLGRVQGLNEQQRKGYIQNFDKNADGLVDRGEVRLFVAQFFQGATFNLGAGGGYSAFGGGFVVVDGRMVYGGGQADVRALLDVDSDGVLNAQEIAAATERLKSRDADDNDLLYPNEISAPPAAGAVRINQPQMAAAPQTALLLGPTAKGDALLAALAQHYKSAAGNVTSAAFSAFPALFAALDRNADGILQAGEALALNEAPPHVALSVDLSTAGKAKGLAIKSLASEAAKTHESPESIKIELPGVRVAIVANLAAAQQVNFGQNGAATISRFDKDNNQYLEKSELPDNFAPQFEVWDIDGDGKVFAAEINASYARMLAPQSSQVAVNVASQGNSLFQALDQTGDGRLSLREMRLAPERVKLLDADGDGRIDPHEIPATISVHIGLASATYAMYSAGRQGGPPAAGPAAGRGAPEWFTRMDRNGDGDVTLKEFLGDEAEFKRLDANGDGFLEAQEAQAAK